jgi:hypothetical protein
MQSSRKLLNRLSQRMSGWQNQLRHRRRIARLTRQVAEHARPQEDTAPVVVFNASTRLSGLSLNAAFSLLTSWSLRLSGVPVIHYVCQQGMSQCVLGSAYSLSTSQQDYPAPPPCVACTAQSDRLYAGGSGRSSTSVQAFHYQVDADLAASLAGLDVPALCSFEYSAPGEIFPENMPLGRLVLPSLRWALRRHTLPDDEPTRYLLREYIQSAYQVAVQFAGLIRSARPQCAVIFNGIMYPEAAARWAAHQLGLRTVAHEVGFTQFSTFFTEGEPTAYPIHLPEDFELTREQNDRLDEYLAKRFQGKFTMAGIQFWPEMHLLDAAFLENAARFRQIVPVFTNVVYDTSQVHANVIFPHMFAWLDLVLEVIRSHPETLFVIRAHPDEMRPGTAKQSNESVRQWVQSNRVNQLDNVVFIDSQEYISSYDLIQRAKFVIVYNSSIGMEAALLHKAVLCGGQARYTQYPIVFFPQSPDEYRQRAHEFLQAEQVDVPPEFIRNARRFLYYQLYRASLPMSDYLQVEGASATRNAARNATRKGFVELRDFSWQQLLRERSTTMQVLHEGILRKKPFLLP